MNAHPSPSNARALPRDVVPVCIVVHDDYYFLQEAVRSFAAAGPVTVFVARRSWHGDDGPWERCAVEAAAAGAEVVVGEWKNESDHRRAALYEMYRRGFQHVLIPDGDEIIEPGLLRYLLAIAREGLADLVHVRMDTYWKSPRYIIRPREELAPVILLDVSRVQHLYIREFSGERRLFLGPEYGLLHHLSYAGPDERIVRKIRSWGHRDELVPGWYDHVWRAWDTNRLLRDLHPTHPRFYGWVERIATPPILGRCRDDEPELGNPEVPPNWPRVSIVVPLYGGEEDIRVCLDSLGRLRDLIHETIVVDDVSPDNAAEVAASYDFATLLRNEQNVGFAATCNRGYSATSGDVVIFLNSDTAVPRAGLIRLVESLTSSEDIGAAGPMTNYAGGHQGMLVTYTTLGTMDLFAQDFAHRAVSDRDVDMLVGFCLAVRRTVLDTVGVFDERFGRGLFEDNDLTYRIQRAGFRCRLASRAFVHHKGSQSLGRMEVTADDLFAKNERIFLDKWRAEIESGYASHLPGQNPEPIVFRPERHPDLLRQEIAKLCAEADISLCMIVRNEERVLEDCLRSVQGIFSQIVVVDTGSTDRTQDIVRSFDPTPLLVEFPWTESFSEARNVSLGHATGKWVMWMDADDTLAPGAGEAILRAAIHAPAEIAGFVIPVRFVNDGGIGTQVDHVKLFRNLPDVRFEGRIHEQILGSLRPHGEIVRLDGALVLHSGYDTSEEGQARKRVRDARLLELDLQERPDHPFVLFNLGMTAHYTGDHEEAVKWLDQSISVAGPAESHIRKAYALLGVSLRELRRPQEALAAFDRGLSVVGPDPELHFQAALILTSLGRLDEARQRYLMMPLDVSGHFTSLDVGILGPKRSHNLGSICVAMERYSEARQHFEEAIRAGFAPSALSLFETAVEREDLKVAQEALDALERLVGRTPEWATCRARLARARGEDAQAELSQSDFGPHLALVRRLLAEDRTEEAEPLLRQLDKEGSAEAAFFLGIYAVRRGDFVEALFHTRRALQREPRNEGTAKQVQSLMQAVAAEREGKEDLLTGAHVGGLGAASVPLSAVVVTYNSQPLIEACVRAALAQMGPVDEMIVVDNASSDGTLQVLRRLMASDARIQVLANEENIGYARAANLGILKSKGDRLVLINPDAILGPGCLLGMNRLMDEGVGAVGPVSDCVLGDQFVVHHLPPDYRPPREDLPAVVSRLCDGKWIETRVLAGFCLLTSRDVLNRYGLLEEACELGADDLELSWRLRQRGLELRIALSAFTFHVGSASFASLDEGQKSSRISRSDAALYRKLQAFYAPNQVPTSEAIWGCDVFAEAMRRIRGELT